MNKALVVLSGGLDSTTALRLSIEEYDEVEAITFYYKQKQSVEVELAKKTCEHLNVQHNVVDVSFLGDIAKTMSSNIVDTNVDMPTIHDILGDPQPVTYVPNRNMILMSIASSYAETKKIKTIICGFQSQDEYGYHDTTQNWLDKLNNLLDENRTHKIKIIAPFAGLSKTDELKKVLELDGNLDLYKTTVTCYDPNNKGESCGVCPSCAERLRAFKNIGYDDPIEYVS